MKKVAFVATLPIWVGYLIFGSVFYIRKKDDMHLSALNDIASWFLDGWMGL